MADAEDKDIPIAEPPGRLSDPASMANAISALYQSLGLTQKYTRQSRAQGIALGTIEVPAPIAELNLTVGGTYNQAQVQSIADKVDVLVEAMNEVLLVLEFIKATSENIEG
jgi:hypothetical protein